MTSPLVPAFLSFCLPAVPADEDMFASDDEKKEGKQGVPVQQAAAAAEAAAQPAAPATAAQAGAPPPAAAPKPAAAAAADETDYSSWPVKELRRFLTERGVVSGRGKRGDEGLQPACPLGCGKLRQRCSAATVILAMNAVNAGA